MPVTHTFASAIADDAAAATAGEVLPSHWNDSHAIDGLLEGDGSVRLALKNTNVDNADNGDFHITAYASDINPISGRWDQVYAYGYNVGPAGVAALSGEHVLGWSYESFYEAGGDESAEVHFFYTNPAGTDTYRLESWAIDRATDEIGHESQFTYHSLKTPSGTQTFKFQHSGSALQISLVTAGTGFYKMLNNEAVISQRNAADSAYLALPFVDQYDRHVFRSFTAVSSMPGGSNNFATIQATDAATSNVLLDILANSITGYIIPCRVNTAASTGVEIQVFNTNNASSSAHAYDRFMVGASGGDAYSRWEINGGQAWSAGLDNSDSDKFKISGSNSLGTSDALAIDSTLNSRFYGNLGIANATNGQACEIKTLTELLTIAAAATSTTTIQKPANSIILAVPVRVTTAVTCTSTFTVGDSGSATRFSTAAVSKAATSTDKGTAAGAYYNATAEGIVITPDTVPSDATGRVRVTIYYIELTPPTS